MTFLLFVLIGAKQISDCPHPIRFAGKGDAGAVHAALCYRDVRKARIIQIV